MMKKEFGKHVKVLRGATNTANDFLKFFVCKPHGVRTYKI